MDNEVTIHKSKIEKINQRIKEYLWQAQYLFEP